MISRLRKRIAFYPAVTEAKLEERLVLSSATVPAPPPFYSPVVISSVPTQLKTAGQLRAAYVHQAQLATLELRNAVGREVEQLYANGSHPTAQQLTDFNASIQGSIDATALGLSSQAALLPGSGTTLVPAVQTALLGAGSRSLSSVISSVFQSSRDTASSARLQSALARAITVEPQRLTSQYNHFFQTTNVKQLSVDSTGQRIPVQQYMAGQVVSQLGNTLGTLAQSYPSVANAMLLAGTTTGTTATTDAVGALRQAVNNALSTAAFQLGNGLSLFGSTANVISEISPMIFGSTTELSSLASTLQNLPLGGTGFNSAVSTALNTGFTNLLSPLSSYLGMPAGSNLSLPTSGLTNLFGTQYSGSNFNSGFNNGFATGTNSGFTGFGVAPTSFNTSYSSGFSNIVSSVSQGQGFVNTFLGSQGVVDGEPVQSR